MIQSFFIATMFIESSTHEPIFRSWKNLQHWTLISESNLINVLWKRVTSQAVTYTCLFRRKVHDQLLITDNILNINADNIGHFLTLLAFPNYELIKNLDLMSNVRFQSLIYIVCFSPHKKQINVWKAIIGVSSVSAVTDEMLEWDRSQSNKSNFHGFQIQVKYLLIQKN